MALPTALLIAVERLKQGDNVLLRHYSRVHPPAVDTGLIDAAIQQVTLDRMTLARDFVASATAMLNGAPREVDLRNATSRAYYAIHHALRAVLLFDLKSDAYGHIESIDEFLKRARSTSSLRTKADAAAITERALLDILHHRHLADYHCYGAADPFEAPVDFSVVAPQAVKFAGDVVAKMEEYLEDRIAGKY
jgi:uncharacterized protein (UPF0332 family)